MGSYGFAQQCSRMLTNMDAWFQTAAEHARTKGFEVDVLAQARLAPDQFSLVQQVQSACDQAKYAAAYLSGTPPPSHPDVEKTIDELRARIQTARAYVDGFHAGDFGPPEKLRVSPAWMGGLSVSGDRYLTVIAIPNFFFHVTTAYAILRHNGVPLGKSDYIGFKDMKDLGAE
jgi:uncharacterized protein